MTHWDTLLSKIQEPSTVQRMLHGAKQMGHTVVFTNGCFDIIHKGHIHYLAAAKDLGDLLVIGLNSDASVNRLKGPKRPINQQDHRAQVLAALSFVDAVVLFEEDTPLELISALQPDVLVKGGDYTIDTIVGASEVLSWGGAVKVLPFVDGLSTTNTINQLKNNG
ncbi:MAG: D-glycero-beta-D-manno-heptose 1-phosphate adenylyltransferase [Schleiferiaceae bacterium]|nr:D-glycero-beta-D-manno-heptose 1-phosphate adenylyltransferase [Schleiferiaceae bacterium]